MLVAGTTLADRYDDVRPCANFCGELQRHAIRDGGSFSTGQLRPQSEVS
jgi:hypothetical protein